MGKHRIERLFTRSPHDTTGLSAFPTFFPSLFLSLASDFYLFLLFRYSRNIRLPRSRCVTSKLATARTRYTSKKRSLVKRRAVRVYSIYMYISSVFRALGLLAILKYLVAHRRWLKPFHASQFDALHTFSSRFFNPTTTISQTKETRRNRAERERGLKHRRAAILTTPSTNTNARCLYGPRTKQLTYLRLCVSLSTRMRSVPFLTRTSEKRPLGAALHTRFSDIYTLRRD